MVNTVGSHENKYWQKKWIPIKRSLSLSDEQKSVIVGSILGDGTMRLGKCAQNANLKIEQGLVQKDYVIWKYQILKSFVYTEPKISYRYQENGEKYPKSWWFRTIRHPLLTKIHNRYYPGHGYRSRRKIVPNNIASDLNPLAIGVWLMDDGSYYRKTISISTYCFSLSNINLLIQTIEKQYQIKSRCHRDRDKGYRMYFNQEETRKLVKLVRSYIIPSMKYKIGDS
jgi:hypothetical protein